MGHLRFGANIWGLAGMVLASLLAGCGGRSDAPQPPAISPNPAATVSAGRWSIPFPASREVSAGTALIQLGADFTQASPEAALDDTALLLDADTGHGVQFALYRFNAGSELPGSLRVALDPAATSGAFVGLADYTNQRWVFQGPLAQEGVLAVDGARFRSPAGNVWVALLVPAAEHARLRELELQTSPPVLLPVLEADLTSGTAPLTVHFSAAGSTDSAGTITDYAWDFDGDGTFDQAGSSALAEHTYLASSVYSATLRVTDEFGHSATAQLSINVAKGSIDNPPLAQFTFSPARGAAPLVVSFDATDSSSPSGPLVTYHWDWDGDGDFDELSNAPQVQHTFSTPGRQHVRLVVTDFSSNESLPTSSAGIVVQGWHAVDNPPLDNATTQLNAINVNNRPLVAYAHPAGGLRCSLALDSDGEAWSAPVLISSEAGVGPLALGMAGGAPAVAYISQGRLRFVRATASDGTTWGAPLTLDPQGSHSLDMATIAASPAIAYYAAGGLRYIRASDAAGTVWPDPVVAYAQPSFCPGLASTGGKPLISFYDKSTGKIRTIRGTDQLGAGWDAPLTVDSVGFTDSVPTALWLGADGKLDLAYVDFSTASLMFSRTTNAAGTGWSVPVALDTGLSAPFSLSGSSLSSAPYIVYRHNASNSLKLVAGLDFSGDAWGPAKTLSSGYAPALVTLNPPTGLTFELAYEAAGELRLLKLF